MGLESCHVCPARTLLWQARVVPEMFFFVFFRVGIATTPKSGEMVKQFKMFDMVSPFLISISFFWYLSQEVKTCYEGAIYSDEFENFLSHLQTHLQWQEIPVGKTSQLFFFWFGNMNGMPRLGWLDDLCLHINCTLVQWQSWYSPVWYM